MKHGRAKRSKNTPDSYTHDAWLDESPRLRAKTHVGPCDASAIRATMICGSTKRHSAAVLRTMKHGRAKRSKNAPDSYTHDPWLDESPSLRAKTHVGPCDASAIRATMICGSTKRRRAGRAGRWRHAVGKTPSALATPQRWSRTRAARPHEATPITTVMRARIAAT
jgi:hypothetical protein